MSTRFGCGLFCLAYITRTLIQCHLNSIGNLIVEMGQSYLHNGISYTGKMTSLYWTNPQILVDSLDWCAPIYQCDLTDAGTIKWLPQHKWCNPVGWRIWVTFDCPSASEVTLKDVGNCASYLAYIPWDLVNVGGDVTLVFWARIWLYSAPLCKGNTWWLRQQILSSIIFRKSINLIKKSSHTGQIAMNSDHQENLKFSFILM